MRVAARIGLFFLFTGISGLAQTSGLASTAGPHSPTTTCTYENDGKGAIAGCPIDMRVRQKGVGSLLSTDANGRRVEKPAARLKLELRDDRPDRTAQGMVTATVTVWGWNQKPRAVPLNGNNESNGDPVKTITVPLAGGGLRDATADLWLPGFTAARIVELDSITYQDGQVWKLEGQASCRVAPDLYMPVTGTH